MADLSSRIAAASGDAGALLALAIELAQENARLAGHAAALEEAERERKAAQASKKRRQRSASSRDVPGQEGTDGDMAGPVVADAGPSTPALVLTQQQQGQELPALANARAGADRPAGEPAAAISGSPAVVPRKGRTKSPATGPSWVVAGSAWWEANVGSMAIGRFGKALSGVVAAQTWEAVFPDMQDWVKGRKAEGKACKLEWYADEASARITSAPPPMWDAERQCLTAYGERVTRPDRVSV